MFPRHDSIFFSRLASATSFPAENLRSTLNAFKAKTSHVKISPLLQINEKEILKV